MVALGVDAAAADPESPLQVTADGYREAGRILGALGLPTVVVQEGGYDLGTIGDSWSRRWRASKGVRHSWCLTPLAMKPLPDGGTIGVAACASPYDMRSELDRGVEWWEAQGYRVKLGAGIHDRDDYVAGDAKRRADDLHALFADPEVDVVQSLQGGFGSSEMLPHLDFDCSPRTQSRSSATATSRPCTSRSASAPAFRPSTATA